jgi:hypothetical protein
MPSLRDKSAGLKGREDILSRFKRRRGTRDNELRVSAILGWRLASVASRCFTAATSIAGLGALSIRNEILHRGASWVGFEELVDRCWQIGVPVIQLCEIPKGNKKMDGMAVWPQEHAVIIIASKRRQPAWHLFYVAHELGHIVLGHLPQGRMIVDERVRFNSTDTEEARADAFAVELLAGDPDITITAPSRRLNSQELARLSRATGESLQIDPGFIALSYAHNQHFYQVGQAALNELTPEADAWSLYKRFYSNLALDQLTEDNRHLFECLVKAEG